MRIVAFSFDFVLLVVTVAIRAIGTEPPVTVEHAEHASTKRTTETADTIRCICASRAAFLGTPRCLRLAGSVADAKEQTRRRSRSKWRTGRSIAERQRSALDPPSYFD